MLRIAPVVTAAGANDALSGAMPDTGNPKETHRTTEPATAAPDRKTKVQKILQVSLTEMRGPEIGRAALAAGSEHCTFNIRGEFDAKP